jgi:hypothetical protein
MQGREVANLVNQTKGAKMAYEQFIAECITAKVVIPEGKNDVNSLVKETLIGHLGENVDVRDVLAVAREVENYLAQLPDMPLDDLKEEARWADGDRKEPLKEAIKTLAEIKKAARRGEISGCIVLAHVFKDLLDEGAFDE